MKRRAFLQVLTVTAVSLTGASFGDPAEAYIQLFHGSRPATEPLLTRFRWNSRIEVTVQPSETIRVDRAVLYSPEVGRRAQEFDVMVITPATELTVNWRLTKGPSLDSSCRPLKV